MEIKALAKKYQKQGANPTSEITSTSLAFY
jgi:hypothetical protein